jgi:PAS domain S-box-containing protein
MPYFFDTPKPISRKAKNRRSRTGFGFPPISVALTNRRTPPKMLFRVFFGPFIAAIVDASGTIMLVNAQTEKLFGYKREELLGKPVEMLMPDRFRGNHLGHREKCPKVPRLRMMGSGMELFGRRKDGTEFPVEISLSPFQEQGRHPGLQRHPRHHLAEAGAEGTRRSQGNS